MVAEDREVSIAYELAGEGYCVRIPIIRLMSNAATQVLRMGGGTLNHVEKFERRFRMRVPIKGNIDQAVGGEQHQMYLLASAT